MNRVTALRLAVVVSSGFADEEALADAVISNVSVVGGDVLKHGSLSKAQVHGIKNALHDTPIAYSSIRGLIRELPLQADDRSNLLFAFAKLVDDMISLGAVAMRGNEGGKIAVSVINGGALGGQKSGAARRALRETTWEPIAKGLARQSRQRDPSASQQTVAADISNFWNSLEHDPPSHATLLKLVIQMIRDGELGPRKPAKSHSSSR